MNRFKIYTAVVALAIGSGFVACSKKAAAPPGGAIAPDGSVVISAPGYEVPISQIENGACPDVAAFFARLKSMPDDAWVRRHTVDFKPGTKNDDGSTTRTNFLTVLTFSSFDILERQMRDYRDQVDVVEQSGCTSLRMLDADGNAREFLIRAASPNTIRLAQPDSSATPNANSSESADSVIMDFAWVNAQEMTVTTTYPVMDFCPDYKMLKVTRTERLRWGPPSLPELQDAEEINASFIGRAVKALALVPDGFSTQELETQAEAGGVMSLRVAELRKLKNSQVRTDLKICPYRAKPPSGDEPPPPEEDATPTPAPTPDTGVERPAPEGPTPPPEATPVPTPPT